MSNYGNYPNIQLCKKYGCHFERKKMLMCTGCFIPEQEKERQFKIVEDKAQAYANEIKKLVVIYKGVGDVPEYMESEAAKSAGVYVIKYIPYLQHFNNGSISEMFM